MAVDASTTSVRTIIFDASGRSVASGRATLKVTRIGRDGYEQDAESWWTGLCISVRGALAELPEHRKDDLVALCIAHQRESFVVTNSVGTPHHAALLWMDNRCHQDVATAERNVGSVRLHAVSGKPACTTPSLYKLMYLFRTVPELQDVSYFHDVHSFLTLKLTGRAVSSLSSADPTSLLDMRKKAWSQTLTRLVGVDTHQLPELVEVGYCVGPLLQSALTETGLPPQILVYAGAGDGPLAGLGAGVTHPGRSFIDLGTAVTCGTLSEKYEVDTSFRTLNAAQPGRYVLETTLRGGMLTLYWLMETILHRTDRAGALLELQSEATRLSPSSEGLVVIPYWAGVMNPYWDDSARGAFIGLHPNHTPAHLFRAILEGIALEQRFHLEGVKGATGKAPSEFVVMGGGSRNDLWCQILADVLGRPVRRCRSAESPARGAAVLASVAHGVHPSFERAAEDMSDLSTSFQPGPGQELYDRLYRDVYRGLYSDLQPRMEALSELRELSSPSMTSIPPPG